jgi:excinuclease ABC subunit A
MGPEGGDGGGEIVAQGTPEEVAASQASHTGRFLREVLQRRPLKMESQKAAAMTQQPKAAKPKKEPARKGRKVTRQAAE